MEINSKYMKARLKNQHTVQIGAKIYNYLNVNKRQSSIFPQQAIVSCGDKIDGDLFHNLPLIHIKLIRKQRIFITL